MFNFNSYNIEKTQDCSTKVLATKYESKLVNLLNLPLFAQSRRLEVPSFVPFMIQPLQSFGEEHCLQKRMSNSNQVYYGATLNEACLKLNEDISISQNDNTNHETLESITQSEKMISDGEEFIDLTKILIDLKFVEDKTTDKDIKP